MKPLAYKRLHTYFPSNFPFRSEIGCCLVLSRNNEDKRDGIFPFLQSDVYLD